MTREELQKARAIAGELSRLCEQLENFQAEVDYLSRTPDDWTLRDLLTQLPDDFINNYWEDDYAALLGQVIVCAIATAGPKRYDFVRAWAEEDSKIANDDSEESEDRTYYAARAQVVRDFAVSLEKLEKTRG